MQHIHVRMMTDLRHDGRRMPKGSVVKIEEAHALPMIEAGSAEEVSPRGEDVVDLTAQTDAQAADTPETSDGLRDAVRRRKAAKTPAGTVPDTQPAVSETGGQDVSG